MRQTTTRTGCLQKISFEERESLIKEIQISLTGIGEPFKYKRCITQMEKDFLLLKNMCLKYSIFTLFRKLSKKNSNW